MMKTEQKFYEKKFVRALALAEDLEANGFETFIQMETEAVFEIIAREQTRIGSTRSIEVNY